MRYLDPKNDLTFKKVFGEHPHILRSFLNALLPLTEGQKITSLEYLSSDMVPTIPLQKYSIVDVRCTDKHGRHFIVEMQMIWTDSFKNRVLFNASKAYVKQLNKGEKYGELKSVYALSLVNEDFEKGTDQHYHHYSIIHNQLTGKRIEGLEFIFIELPKFKAKNITEKKLQVLWLRYLTEIRDQTVSPPKDLFADPDVKEAIECLEESAFTPAQLAAYDKYWDGIAVEKTRLADSKKAGLEEGKQIGLEEGKQIGLEEGIQLMSTVVRMFHQGNDISTIAQATRQAESFILQILTDAGLKD